RGRTCSKASFMNLWLAVAAGLLAILASFHLVNPYVLLFCVFLIGVGFAFSRPRLVRNCSGRVIRRRVAARRDAGWIAIECFGNHRPSAGWYSALLFRSELGFLRRT